MSAESEEAFRFIDDLVMQRQGKRLNDIQRAVFLGTWDDLGYKAVRSRYRLGCSSDYLMKDVGPELWKLLGEILGEKVTKKNLKGPVNNALRRADQIPEAGPPSGTTLLQNKPAHDPQPSFMPPVELPHTRVDWGDAPDIACFYGQERELTELTQWLTFSNCRLLAIVGIAGAGKTYLAVKLAQEVRDQFEYLFWRSLQPAPTLDDLLAELIPFVSDQQEATISLSRLLYYLKNKSCLIVLDGFEAILQSGVHDGAYKSGYEGYAELLRQVGSAAHQSRLLLTSREKPRQVASVEGENQLIRSCLLKGIGEQAGWQIFTGRRGALSLLPDPAWNLLFQRCAGHPLALKVVVTQVCEVFDGDIGKFLTKLQNETIIMDELKEALEQQFERLSELEAGIVDGLTTAPEPIEVEDLLRLLAQPISRSQLIEGLQSLRRRSLLAVEAAHYWLHPLLLELRQQQL